jgi:molecular chaperone IbpA
MHRLDFAPLYRASVGFDQIADMMDRVLSAPETSQSTYPPYNIEKTDDDSYRISVAVAGFSDSDLSVEQRENAVIVAARKTDTDEKTYLHRGIATRAFERRFHLADHVRVTGASHVDGMLHIDLAREVPEALKPRRIEIGGQRAVETDVIEADKVN